ncbi:hypothetical protein DOZ58_18310 [Acetobacterium sp. KB-1]|nr:hypothetical protein DOZ58_18310 [Acetobacterium sp. KB-1]
MPDECTPELYDSVRRISESIRRESSCDEAGSLRDDLSRAIENSVREQLGFKKIGDAWVSETMLYQIVKSLFPHEKVIRHHRPDWLEGLELDIFLPDIKLGLEYQGIQHFKAINHWGGMKQLKVQQEHDDRKMRLCDEAGIRLICVNYDEPLTEEHIRHKLT